MKRNSTNELLAAEAAQWFTLMQDAEVGGRERAKFSEWLGQSADHVHEYLAVASMWRHLEATSDASRSTAELISAARAAGNATNVVALRAQAAPTISAARTPRRHAWAVACVLMLAVVIGGFWAERQLNGELYATRVGEQTSFTLADGSVVRLNTQSKLRVRFGERVRDIQLLAGEAMFEVAKDARRPFRVHAGDAMAEAVGTSFNVYRAKDETRITVLEGRVRVSAEAAGNEVGAKAAIVAELAPRERVHVGAGGGVIREGEVNVEQTTAWTSRRLIFDTETLQTVIEEFNRYNRQQLQVSDPQLAELRITGNFRATDPASLVQFLERTESVGAAEQGERVLALFRKNSP